MGRWTKENFQKAIADYDELTHGVGSNSQEATIALLGLKPIRHQGIYSPGGWGKGQTTNILY